MMKCFLLPLWVIFNLFEGLHNHLCFQFVLKDFGAFSVFIPSYFFPLFQLFFTTFLSPNPSTLPTTVSPSLSRRNLTRWTLPLPLFSHCAPPLSPLHSPRCICNAACTASCNGRTGAWLAEGSTSLLSARSHLTDQTSLLFDNNSSCFMTQFLSDLVFPIGVDVPQHSAFQRAYI